MKMIRFLVPALLAAGCNSGGGDAPAVETSPGESEELSEAESPEGEAEDSDDRPNGFQTTPVVEEARWVGCDEEFVASIREFPIQVDGAETSLGERLDAGVVAEAIEPLDNSFRDGTWMCFEGGEERLLEYRAALNGVDFGPQWVLVDARTLRPTNLLAEAIHGTWSATEGADDAVRKAITECRAGGNWLTSGAYIHLIGVEGGVAPEWTVLPDTRAGRGETYQANLTWRAPEGRLTARWRVVPGNSICEPLTEPARRITDIAAAIPRHRRELAAGSPRPNNQPSAQHSERGRALAYVFAEQRELRAVADHLEFEARQDPFEVGEWEVTGRPDAAGHREVSLRINRSNPVNVSYSVHPESGVTNPNSPESTLARAVLPLRMPGVGDLSDVPLRLEQDVIDAHLGEVLDDLGACIPAGASQLSAVWWIAWDGHTFDISAEPADRHVTSCVVDVLDALRFPQFRGPAVRASSTVSMAQ